MGRRAGRASAGPRSGGQAAAAGCAGRALRHAGRRAARRRCAGGGHRMAGVRPGAHRSRDDRHRPERLHRSTGRPSLLFCRPAAMTLQGRNAIITGANQGLGLAIAHAYVRAGANVLISARESERLEAAARALREAAPERTILAEAADVSRDDDARRIVARSLDALGSVEILVNNAGIYGPMGTIDEIDWAEWTRAVEVNLFGSVLTCRHLLPHMRGQRYGKIIQLSGGGATAPLPRMSAYAASKAAVVRFAETVAEEVRGQGIDVNAIAPGPLNTRMLDQVLEAGPSKVGDDFFDRAVKQKHDGGAPLERGADLAVFLGSAASDGITGKILSAICDPWPELPAHASDPQGDVYTLRRIVPRDRGFGWGDR